jgi:hypothetical protein
MNHELACHIGAYAHCVKSSRPLIRIGCAATISRSSGKTGVGAGVPRGFERHENAGISYPRFLEICGIARQKNPQPSK